MSRKRLDIIFHYFYIVAAFSASQISQYLIAFKLSLIIEKFLFQIFVFAIQFFCFSWLHLHWKNIRRKVKEFGEIIALKVSIQCQLRTKSKFGVNRTINRSEKMNIRKRWWMHKSIDRFVFVVVGAIIEICFSRVRFIIRLVFVSLFWDVVESRKRRKTRKKLSHKNWFLHFVMVLRIS